MTGKELLKEIKAHCRRTGESPYTFGKRVLGDQTFVWKLKNSQRNPIAATVKKVQSAIKAANSLRAAPHR